MTPNLPLSLAQLIPTMFHVEAEAALVAHVENLLASRVELAKEDLLRSIVAHVASYGLAEPPTQEAPPVPVKQHIAAGERGVNHEQYVATFRAKFPNGERELRGMLYRFPPGTKLSRMEMDEIKRHFGMGARSLLLSPMLRDLGCRDDSRGQWITPVLRTVCTGGF
jgi:hypothetical protein